MKILILVSLLFATHVFAKDEVISKQWMCRRLDKVSLQLADELTAELINSREVENSVSVVLTRIEDRRILLNQLCRGLATDAQDRLAQLQNAIELNNLTANRQ